MLSDEIFPIISTDDIKTLYTSSTPCTLTLVNNDNIICCGHSFKKNNISYIIAFHPVILDGFVDENQVYQYIFKKPNLASDDVFIVLREDKILFVNSLSQHFREEYLRYCQDKTSKAATETTVKDNVVPLNTTRH